MRRSSSAGAVLTAAVLCAGCGSGGLSAAQVARAAGATACVDSGAYIQSRITGRKDEIYNCRFSSQLPKCVTYASNVATDVTGEASLLFASALNARAPKCLAEHRAAAARRARAAAAAKQRRYVAALKADLHAPWHLGYFPYLKGVAHQQLPDIWFKWVPASSCSAYVQSCWKVEIVTRRGCPSGLSVEVEERRGGAQIGTAYGEAGALAARTPAIVEIDTTDSGRFSGSLGSITCY